MKNHIYFGFLPYHTVGQTKLKIRSKAALYSVKSFIPWVFNERPIYISLVLYHKISTQWDVGERKEFSFIIVSAYVKVVLMRMLIPSC